MSACYSVRKIAAEGLEMLPISSMDTYGGPLYALVHASRTDVCRYATAQTGYTRAQQPTNGMTDAGANCPI